MLINYIENTDQKYKGLVYMLHVISSDILWSLNTLEKLSEMSWQSCEKKDMNHRYVIFNMYFFKIMHRFNSFNIFLMYFLESWNIHVSY